MSIRRLSILAYPESSVWTTARCLEHDLMTSGRTADLAVDALLKMIRAHVDYDTRHQRAPLSAFLPAPKLYREAFKQGEQRHQIVEANPLSQQATTTVIDVAVVRDHPVVRPFAAVARIA